MNAEPLATPVLGVAVHAASEGQAVERIVAWAQARESRVVCFVNAHSTVTAQRDPAHAAALAQADLKLPDGAPVAWMLRHLGHAGQPRVSGPDVMAALLRRCAELALPVFVLGSTEATLARLRQALLVRWPALLLVGQLAPPFSAWDSATQDRIATAVASGGAAVVLVGLGCPKQERWMAEQRGRLNAVMLGVGAAFDFHAGTIKRAPRWMQSAGLEWLHRLLQEPRRLGPRYVFTNLAFVVGALKQLREHAQRPRS